MIDRFLRSFIRYLGIVVGSIVISYFGYLFFALNAKPLRSQFTYENIDIKNPLFIANEKSGYNNRPNVHSEKISSGRVNGEPLIIRTLVIHDTDGARIPMSGNEESELPVDIITVGGSQTWGQGVKAEHSFPYVFASTLGASARNYAVSGFGGASAYYILKEKLEKKSPKYVVYGFWEDHLNRNLRYCANNTFPVCSPLAYVSGTSDKDFKLLPAKNAEELFDDFHMFIKDMQGSSSLSALWKDLYWAHRRFYRKLDNIMNPRAYDKAPISQKVQAAGFVLRQMASLVHKTGAKFIVVYIPLYFSETIMSADPYFFKTARENDFLFIDLSYNFGIFY